MSVNKGFHLKTIIQQHRSEKLIALHQTAIGNFHFFESYVVTEFKEGILVDFESCNEFCLLLNRYYSTQKKFAIISKRKFSYSINPTDYRYLKVMLHNLKGIAIVTQKQDEPQKSKLICIEKRLCPRPFSVFTSLTKAENWVASLVA